VVGRLRNARKILSRRKYFLSRPFIAEEEFRYFVCTLRMQRIPADNHSLACAIRFKGGNNYRNDLRKTSRSIIGKSVQIDKDRELTEKQCAFRPSPRSPFLSNFWSGLSRCGLICHG
jgi:hypothetical protein